MADHGLHLINFATVKPEKVEFLIHPYIPIGKLTLIEGDPGGGKTMIALRIAADISTGRIPFGEERGPAAPVIFQTAEDGIADTIVPRLLLMNPCMEQIYSIDESLRGLSLTDKRLELAIAQIRPALVILDPLQAYLGSSVDMHRANQVRPVLTHVKGLAEKYHCAVVFIVHMSKMAQSKALYRVLGSIDIPAAARSLLVVGSDPNDPSRRVVAHEKSSLAPAGKSIAFRIDGDQGVVVDGYCDLDASKILGSARQGKGSSSLSVAKSMLQDCMSEVGYADLADIKFLARQVGISERTLHYAKQALDIESKTYGFDLKQTYWLLPGVDPEKVIQTEL